MNGNHDPKTALLATLRTMEPGPKYWDASYIDTYDLGLQDIPSEACGALTKAVLHAFERRPSVKQIMELYAELSSRQEAKTLTDVLAELRELVSRYGEYGTPKRIHPDEKQAFYVLGPPRQLADMPPAVARTVYALGGWVEFARNFDWSDAADRAQFRDLFKAATGTASEAALRSLRRELQASRPVQIDSPKEPTAPDFSETTLQPTREEASAFFAKLGGRQIGRSL